MSVKRLQYGKTAAGVCLFAMLLVLLAACGKPSVFDGSRTADKNGFQMDYRILNREETADLELSAGDQLQVVLAHTGGNVDVSIVQQGGEIIYRGTAQTNAEFSVTISAAGTCHITVTGHQAQGRVSFIRVPAASE